MSMRETVELHVREREARAASERVRDQIAEEIQRKQSGSMLASDYVMIVKELDAALYRLIMNERGIVL